ncbi:MAG: leucine-rich repeat domain-containing protein [Paludibacteraceae bacterium]|nr:leucine-rich repeat domain-containing protein [Paludibacteraceae bacterium]
MEDEFYDILFPPYTGHVRIGELYYDLYIDRDTLEGTAEVVRDPMASDDKTNYPDLTIARIPASVTYRDEEFIVTTIGSMAFADCSNLRVVELPDTITCIEEMAFFGCERLTSIVFPDSVTRVGKSAFLYCELASLHIPDSVTEIGDRAFDDSLIPAYNAHIFANMPHSIIGGYSIPDGIKTITAGAFSYRKITSIVLPASVEQIRDEAFGGCNGLVSITCKASVPPALGDDVFLWVDKSIPLYAPAESVSLYKSAPQWSEFTNIKATNNL